jgi:hypothetical protein
MNTPDGNRLFMILDGEFEYETSDKAKDKRALGG